METKWSRKQKLLVAVVCATNLLANSAYSLIAPFFPPEALQKGVPDVFVGLVFSSYSLSMFLATPGYKKLIDRHGTFNLLTIGLITQSVSIIILGFASFIYNWELFVFFCISCRLVGGFGNGCLNAACK